MTQDELLSQLRLLQKDLSDKFGIQKIAIFGSYARDEAQDESDVDIAILKISEQNLSKRLDAIKFLENKLHKKIDMGYYDSMKTFIKNRIKKDFIYV